MNSITRWCASTAAGVWDKTRSTVQLVYHVGDQLRLVYHTANSREECKHDLDATLIRVGGFAGAAVLLIIVDVHGGVPNTLRRLRALLVPEDHTGGSVAATGRS
ncbi:hypothetical protein ABL78_1843 [Leptomonas seymouri]|uniref:Uncharacterized protein n=1 Tax=Leptomonas seymouri TaxID=5684 RepID=A0A0N1IA12_LEPSE|nr:hypothetical protein ABL78_1843 [Leptomonas seymouri]|eukprot:KPI89030.1 hypothetical protein ABL78_1843 [Leptomonas seymouri]